MNDLDWNPEPQAPSPELPTQAGPTPASTSAFHDPKATPEMDGARVAGQWTLPEAIIKASSYEGVVGFASPHSASHRVTTPQDLIAIIEAAHERSPRAGPPQKVYTVGEDGSIFNTTAKTKEPEWLAVRAAGSDAPSALPSSPAPSAQPTAPAAALAGVNSTISGVVGTLETPYATASNEAFFWSGRTGGVGGSVVAEAFAKKGGGTTLEMLNEAMWKQLPKWNDMDPTTVKAWDNASKLYARGASGEVRVMLGDSLRSGNTWERIEFPTLEGGGKVTRIVRIDPASGAETVLFEASTAQRAVGAVKTAGTLAFSGLAVAGAGLSGYQVGTGIDKMLDPRTRPEGAVDVGQGTANLALSIGVPIAVKTGAIVTEAGAIVGATATAAGLAAGASVGLAAETVRAAVRGQDTPIDVMDKAYGTHFGDIYGWIKGVYRKR